MKTYKLGEIAEYINGRAFKPTERENNGSPIIRIQNLNDENASFNFSTKKFDERYLIAKGDVLFARSGSLGTFIWNREDGRLNQHIFKVVPNENLVNKQFLFFALIALIKKFESKTHGATMVHITKPEFLNTEIYLPPLDTQRAIADKLDKLQSLIDLKKQTIAKTDDLAKSIFLEMFGDPMTNEKGWKIMTIKEICEDLFAGGDAPKIYSENRSKEFNIPIYSNGIGIKALYGFTKIPRVLKSSITISARGTIGYCAIINEPFFPIVRLIVMTPKENITNLNYLKYVIDSMNIHGNGGSIPQLTIPMIKDKKISVPPLSLQQKFADIITEIESQKSAHKEALEKLENLYHSEMQRSFSLEL